MAGADGQTTDSVNILQALEQQPHGFSFFRAVRMLECQTAEFPRIGYSNSPAKDPIRFCQLPSLAFAPSTLESLRYSESAHIPQLYVRFFGLFGPNAPLPPHLTEYALERELHHGDATLREFCNVFHHRLISFFYRAWADCQKVLDLDRPKDQRFSFYIGSFAGLGMETLQNQDSIQDWAKLFFAGRLACQPRNAEGLEAILGQYFEIPAQVHQFAGRWMQLPSNALCRMGESPETGQLGLTTIVGEHIWDAQLNFRIRLGPMKLADYERLLPHGKAFARLKDWILQYCGKHFCWDVQLVLRADEVPSTCLGQGGRLGWTTWLKTKPFVRDAEDLVILPPGNN